MTILPVCQISPAINRSYIFILLKAHARNWWCYNWMSRGKFTAHRTQLDTLSHKPTVYSPRTCNFSANHLVEYRNHFTEEIWARKKVHEHGEKSLLLAVCKDVQTLSWYFPWDAEIFWWAFFQRVEDEKVYFCAQEEKKFRLSLSPLLFQVRFVLTSKFSSRISRATSFLMYELLRLPLMLGAMTNDD